MLRPLSRRSKTEPSTGASPVNLPGTAAGGPVKKGRPTPTRREAEAAAKARAKVPRSRKEISQAQRSSRTESSQKMRAAMKTGEEKYLPVRDKGPARRFIRDFVDSRFHFVELMIPLLIVTMILGYSGSDTLRSWSSTILLGTILLIVVDVVVMRFRLRRQLARRFPEVPLKGTTYYAVSRALQMKFMRLPKSKVRIGQELPEHYR